MELQDFHLPRSRHSHRIVEGKFEPVWFELNIPQLHQLEMQVNTRMFSDWSELKNFLGTDFSVESRIVREIRFVKKKQKIWFDFGLEETSSKKILRREFYFVEWI